MMKVTKLSLVLNAALGLTLGVIPVGVYAAALNNGDVLTISSGISSGGVKSVSWFAMNQNDLDLNSDDVITPDEWYITDAEKIVLRSGTNGLVIGAVTAAGAYHAGVQTAPPAISPANIDTGAVLKSWSFFGQTGSNYSTVAITGDTVAGLNMSGWKVAWNTLPSVPMDAAAWTPANAVAAGAQSGVYSNGIGKLSWSGTCGDPYALDYASTVPGGSGTGFDGVQYFLHLSGFALTSTCAGVVTTLPVDLQTLLSAADMTSYVVKFNEAMTPASVTSSFLGVSGGVTVGTPVASDSNKVFTFPLTGVAGGVTYTVTPNTTGVTTVSGNPVIAATAYARTFTTFADTTAPTVVSTTPADGATIPRNTGTVSVTFSEPVTNVLAGAISINNGVTVGAPTGSNSNKTWTFPITSGTLAALTTYTLSFNAGPKDPSNNALTLPAARTFTTTANINAVLSAATSDTLVVCPGSKFGMEVSAGNTTWTSITQHNPITIGLAQAGGSTHSGVPNGSEALAIDNAWSFFGNTGLHYTASAVTDYGNSTMDFSGWRVSWNGLASIDMGGGLPATFTWDGTYGHAYTLTYQANVPPGDPSNFGGVLYTLSLTGVVNGGPSNVNAACAGSVVTPKGGVAITNPGGGLTVSLNSQMVPDSSDPAFASSYSTAGAPAGYDFYKYGAITYTVTGLTQGQASTVTFTLPDPVPTGTKLYKISSTGYREIASAAYTIAGSTITLNVVDDGDLDTCKAPVNGGTCTVGVFIDPLAIGVPIALAANATGSATGGSGGCAYNPNGKFDLGMLLALFGSLGYLGWRRTRQ